MKERVLLSTRVTTLPIIHILLSMALVYSHVYTFASINTDTQTSVAHMTTGKPERDALHIFDLPDELLDTIIKQFMQDHMHRLEPQSLMRDYQSLLCTQKKSILAQMLFNRLSPVCIEQMCNEINTYRVFPLSSFVMREQLLSKSACDIYRTHALTDRELDAFREKIYSIALGAGYSEQNIQMIYDELVNNGTYEYVLVILVTLLVKNTPLSPYYDPDLLRKLIRLGFPVNQPIQGNDTNAFLLSIDNEETDNVDILLESGAAIDIKARNGITPLMWAAYKRQIATVKLLLENNASTTEVCYAYGMTAFHYAVIGGHQKIVDLLLSNSDINKQDRYGNTPLMRATMRQNTRLVQFLLSKNAQPDIENNDGNTPILIAASTGNIAIIRSLLSKGANIDWQNKDGNCVLNFASGQPAVVAVLRDYKLNHI